MLPIGVLSVLLAATSAAVWGTGDFSGGKASQRSNALAVTVLSQLFGLPVLFVCVLVFSGGSPDPRRIIWGAVAGVAGFAGILLLYRGLAQGAMAIFAPVSAVTSAIIPMGVGLVLDRAPTPLALFGALLAIVAIGLVSMSGSKGNQAVTPRLIGLALATGVMFGVFFALLGQAGPNAGMWPLVGVRVGSLTVGLAVALGTRTPLRLARGTVRWTLSAGMFDILANALYLLAAARGVLTIVAPIASLYPVSTVLLALGIDREHVRPVQLAGLGLAATALVLVAT